MSSVDPQRLQAFPEELAEPGAWLEPFDWYRQMRETAPVRYDPARRSWDVFRYDDVKAILDDDETFSVSPRRATHYEEPEDDEQGLMLDTMLFQDPPRHDELRSVVDDAFRPREIRDLEPRLREMVSDLLDETLADADGEADVVSALAYPFPVIAIAELLGVPTEDREQFKEWSDGLVATASGDDESEVAQRREQLKREMAWYFLDLIDRRREDPRDDLVSTIATAETADGDTLTDQEALGMCVLLLVAGNITTTNLLTNAVRCFGNHDLFDDLAGDEDALATAIEEVMRYRSPVQTMARVATEDVTMGDATIEAGDRVVAWLGSANRDERAFEDADAFVPDRSPNQHLGFGSGTHYCLGAPLARLEAKVALSELLSRLSNVRLVDADLTPTDSSFIYGVKSLPIRFDPA